MEVVSDAKPSTIRFEHAIVVGHDAEAEAKFPQLCQYLSHFIVEEDPAPPLLGSIDITGDGKSFPDSQVLQHETEPLNPEDIHQFLGLEVNAPVGSVCERPPSIDVLPAQNDSMIVADFNEDSPYVRPPVGQCAPEVDEDCLDLQSRIPRKEGSRAKNP